MISEKDNVVCLGHASVTVTGKHYAALSDEGKREAVNTLSKLPNGVRVQLLQTAKRKRD